MTSIALALCPASRAMVAERRGYIELSAAAAPGYTPSLAFELTSCSCSALTSVCSRSVLAMATTSSFLACCGRALPDATSLYGAPPLSAPCSATVAASSLLLPSSSRSLRDSASAARCSSTAFAVSDSAAIRSMSSSSSCCCAASLSLSCFASSRACSCSTCICAAKPESACCRSDWCCLADSPSRASPASQSAAQPEPPAPGTWPDVSDMVSPPIDDTAWRITSVWCEIRASMASVHALLMVHSDGGASSSVARAPASISRIMPVTFSTGSSTPNLASSAATSRNCSVLAIIWNRPSSCATRVCTALPNTVVRFCCALSAAARRAELLA